MFEFKGKRILVTGGAAHLARAHTKRMATPGEVAAAVLYLASDEAASTTGAALTVDGGGTAGF